jgi:tetratricopeptide (TPR) repeat protein
MRRHLFAFLCAVLPLPGARALPNDPTISGLYARGLAGDRAAVTECIDALEKLLAVQPNEQVARVYLGSAYTLRSRDLPIGPAKLSALRKGIALMDEAAAAAPQNAKVQLTRAVTNEALPAFLGRRKMAREQLEQLVAQIEKDPAKLTPADQQLLYLNAGEAAKKAGDTARAHELWQRGAVLKADSKLTREIEIALASPRSNL